MKPEVSPTAVYDSFNHAFPEQSHGPNAARPRGLDAIRDRAYREAVARVKRQGWEVVTIVSLHPFQLDLNMGYLGHLTVPPKKHGDLYALKVVDQPKFDAKDLGDGKVEYIPVFPKEQAEDLIHNYVERENMGGVFCYMGTGEVPTELLEAAQKAQLNWYWRLFEEGNANWSQFQRNPKYITDRMRDAAKELWRLKLVSAQPEWITVTKNESPDGPCEGCGAVISKQAAFCQHCHTIFNSEWVRARRPDIWKAQNPAETEVSSVVAKHSGASSAERAEVERFIAEEEAAAREVLAKSSAKKAKRDERSESRSESK